MTIEDHDVLPVVSHERAQAGIAVPAACIKTSLFCRCHSLTPAEYNSGFFYNT